MVVMCIAIMFICNQIQHLPLFASEIAQHFPFDKYNDELGAPFVLDSIRERNTDKDIQVTYKVFGNRLAR